MAATSEATTCGGMTDSRPETTVRVDGACVVLQVGEQVIPMSPEDATWLGLQLSRGSWQANWNRDTAARRAAKERQEARRCNLGG
jgi:hypothetical protein